MTVTSDPACPPGIQRMNVYQQPWGLFAVALDILDPAFEAFAAKYHSEGWVYRRNVNRQPARQIDKRLPELPGNIWFCMGVQAVGHWYQVELTEETPYEFDVVARCDSRLGQSLVKRGTLIEPAPIRVLTSRIKTLLEDGKSLIESWSLPHDVTQHVAEEIDGWKAGPYFPQHPQKAGFANGKEIL